MTRSGLRVMAAHNASSALRFAASAPPRVAILDYQLPDKTGLVLAAELHAALPALHIILTSASSLDVDQAILDRAGVKAFVGKPMPPGPLREAVMRLLER